MTTRKTITISKATKKLVFDLENFPEGEYDVQLLLEKRTGGASGMEYDLSNWNSGIKINPLPAFRREDMYGEDEGVIFPGVM
jgi:hypothetical protein